MLTRSRILIVSAVLLGLPDGRREPRPRRAHRSPHRNRQFGANIGDDYFLANYTQLEAYWQTLDRESDRVTLADIGRTEEGRTQWMAIVSAPENSRHSIATGTSRAAWRSPKG